MEIIKDKIILIIGATGSIGSKTAKLLAAGGAQLFIAGRNKEKLIALAKEVNLPSDKIFPFDICNPQDIDALKDYFFSQYTSIDVLINAAGIGVIKPMDELSADEFTRTINTNLTGPFLVLKSFLPKMKENKKGLVIHIPGILGKVPMAGSTAYSASKYGLVGMLQSVREEIKRTEIRITNLFLGGVDTAFWDSIDLRIQRDKMIIAGEAAKAIWFLCQQPASGVVSEMVIQPFNHQVI